MQNTQQEIIEKLELLPHPEGGYYKEVYRSEAIIKRDALPSLFRGDRAISTLIYYMLLGVDFSAFHRIKSDEIWHFYKGETLLIHEINIEGQYFAHRLGSNIENGDNFQVIIPAGSWFAAELESKCLFALVGCTVSPGFDFEDFEMANRNELINTFPKYEEFIVKLTR